MDNSTTWQTAEDIRRDLFEYSNLEYPGDTFLPAPPKTIAEYRARTSQVKNPELFDENIHSADVFISGRGRYIKDRIIRPGRPVEAMPEDDFTIEKKIREVSGLGYGNEIIERAFSGLDSDDEDDGNESHIIPQLMLRPSGDASSNSTSPELPMFPQKADILPNFESMRIEKDYITESIISRENGGLEDENIVSLDVEEKSLK